MYTLAHLAHHTWRSRDLDSGCLLALIDTWLWPGVAQAPNALHFIFIFISFFSSSFFHFLSETAVLFLPKINYIHLYMLWTL